MFGNGVKLIYYNIAGIRLPDDDSYPFRVDVKLRQVNDPDMGQILMGGGTIKITAIAKSQKALKKYIRENNFSDHPRLISLDITQRPRLSFMTKLRRCRPFSWFAKS